MRSRFIWKLYAAYVVVIAVSALVAAFVASSRIHYPSTQPAEFEYLERRVARDDAGETWPAWSPTCRSRGGNHSSTICLGRGGM
ncbi:MAG: hypothetical protein HY815_05195 [Candidatus Riflebacteria bacterium]|nr:hypothetical protein [Candidatus Riflebacteria bacterium]